MADKIDLSKLHFLVVDSNHFSRMMLHDGLRPFGVHGFADAIKVEDALNALRGSEIDV